MKNLIVKAFNEIFLRRPRVRYCSQTIYETLLGCLRLWDATSSERWKGRAEKICQILLKIQRPDGGFDIGYDFNFGRLHKKGDSTSPELIGLLALVEYHKRFGGDEVKQAAHRAADWIRGRAIRVSEDEWAIPYSPYNIQEVMVYNGTSFAAGALGVYLAQFPAVELQKIYEGMVRYLSRVMSRNSEMAGRFWFYSDQSRTDLDEKARAKIDYYHQMQQVEMHSLAQMLNPVPEQLELIRDAVDHVLVLQDEQGVIPYLNTPLDVALWGYCSCLSGFLLAARLFQDQGATYRAASKKVLKWICANAWNGSFFYATVTAAGVPSDQMYYVRSDAWVFNSLALAVVEGQAEDDVLAICDSAYQKMERCEFSGMESHASNLRVRFVRRSMVQFGKVKRYLKGRGKGV